jgi:hypothetical protein
MNKRKLITPIHRLLSAGTLLFVTALLVLGVEAALSTWVYRDKGHVEPAFCKGEFAYTANCLNPHPLFHLRIAGLAIYNAITMKPAYRARRFGELTERELGSLDHWKGRGNWKISLPWNPDISAEYFYDSLGRRVPAETIAEKPKSKFLAFLGGSWVHGDWLPYSQTLPGQMQTRMPQFKVYNYGIQGGGLQEVFLGSHGPDFNRGIPEERGVFVYVHNWMHFDRLRPSVAYIGGRFDSPMADYLDDRELGFGGTFYQHFPVLTPALAFAHYSGIGKLVGLTHRMIPEWEVERLYCDMLVQTRDQLESRKKSAKFVVLIYGRDDKNEGRRNPVRCLEENNIPYLAPFFDEKLVETRLPDGHPDANAHRIVAGQFTSWVGQFLRP